LDGNGTISFQEFRAGLHRRDIHVSSGRARRVFQLLGVKRRNGVLTKEEFEKIIFYVPEESNREPNLTRTSHNHHESGSSLEPCQVRINENVIGV